MCPYKRNLFMKEGGSLDYIHISSVALGSVGCDLFDYAGSWAPVASEAQHHSTFLTPPRPFLHIA